MDRTERIAQLHGLLSSHRRGLSYERLMAQTSSSRSTLYRDLCFMRDTLGAPLEHEGEPARVWRYVNRNLDAFQLPGVWLSADELYALMLAQQVLKQSGAGLLGQALGPLQPRIQKILGDKANHLDRLLVMRTQARHSNPSVFRIVTEAVLGRLQLRFRYQARSTAEEKERQVSPQRLIHHRDNWYLDASEVGQTSVRRFALDRIRRPELSPEPAVPIPVADLDAQGDAGYGIFAGPVTATASGPRHSLGRSSAQNAAHSQRADSPTSPPTPPAGSPTSTGTHGNSNASSPMAAWNSPSPTPTRANC